MIFLVIHWSSQVIKATILLLQDRDYRWADVYVTEVIDACHFWAHVGGKPVIEKVEAINRELLSQVRNEVLVTAMLC